MNSAAKQINIFNFSAIWVMVYFFIVILFGQSPGSFYGKI